MTQTEDRALASVPDDEEKKPRSKQIALDLGAPPRFSFERIAVGEIHVSGFGAPPSDKLVTSIGTLGVLKPIILEPDGGPNGTFAVIDGRRRLVAAMRNELEDVPAFVLVGGDLDLHGAAIPLATNDARDANPIIELEAIEEIIRQRPGISLPTIAKELGVKLKTLRARIRLSGIRSELRDAAKAGQFGTKVLEALARCDEIAQSELVRRLDANGTITIEDVRDVKKTGVRDHQRELPGDRRYTRAIERLEEVRKDLFLELGEKHEAMVAIADAIDALRELE